MVLKNRKSTEKKLIKPKVSALKKISQNSKPLARLCKKERTPVTNIRNEKGDYHYSSHGH